MKHYASVVGNRGQKHAYACSLLFRSSNDLRSRQDSGFPQDFFIFIFIFHFHVSHSRQDSGYDRRARVLWSRLGFLQVRLSPPRGR